MTRYAIGLDQWPQFGVELLLDFILWLDDDTEPEHRGGQRQVRQISNLEWETDESSLQYRLY